MRPCGPNASRMSRSWRPRWTKPRRSRPVARCSSVELDLVDREPRPRGVDRHPASRSRSPARAGRRLRARRRQLAAGPRAAPARRSPSRAGSAARAAPLASPKPPPCLRANAATVRSASPVEQRRQLAAQVGVAEQERPAAPPARRASAPVPCRGAAAGGRAPRRPRRVARSASREPSSATITSASGNCRRSSATVVPIARPSSRAAISIVSGSSTRRGQRLDRRQDPSARVADAVVAAASVRRAGARSASAPTGVSTPSTVERLWRWKTGIALCSTRVGSTPTAGTPALPSPE